MEEGLILNNQELNHRKERLQKLLELNYTYPIQDRRLIQFLTLLDCQLNQKQDNQHEVYQSYHQLQNIIKKYALTGNQVITETQMLKSKFAYDNHMKLSDLEQLFQQEMHISIDEFIEDYMTRSDNLYERWGMTNIPVSEEIMNRYSLSNKKEVRDTYRFQKDGENNYREIYHPTIMAFISYLENKKTKEKTHEDYQKNSEN